MTDTEIIDLYFARSEDAVAQTAEKYGALCRTIAGNILGDDGGRDECVQDVYYRAWESIPPTRPQNFKGWLACVTRSLALSRWRREHAERRGGGICALSLDELAECVPGGGDPAAVTETAVLTQALDRFLKGLRALDRRIFLQRYWYFRSVREIAGDLGVTESRVKVSLHRSRETLRRQLEQEGITI